MIEAAAFEYNDSHVVERPGGGAGERPFGNIGQQHDEDQ
jgi:hypothetical protein